MRWYYYYMHELTQKPNPKFASSKIWILFCEIAYLLGLVGWDAVYWYKTNNTEHNAQRQRTLVSALIFPVRPRHLWPTAPELLLQNSCNANDDDKKEKHNTLLLDLHKFWLSWQVHEKMSKYICYGNGMRERVFFWSVMYDSVRLKSLVALCKWKRFINKYKMQYSILYACLPDRIMFHVGSLWSMNEFYTIKKSIPHTKAKEWSKKSIVVCTNPNEWTIPEMIKIIDGLRCDSECDGNMVYFALVCWCHFNRLHIITVHDNLCSRIEFVCVCMRLWHYQVHQGKHLIN